MRDELENSVRRTFRKEKCMCGKYRIRLKGEILMKWDRGETLSGLLIGRKSQSKEGIVKTQEGG